MANENGTLSHTLTLGLEKDSGQMVGELLRLVKGGGSTAVAVVGLAS